MRDSHLMEWTPEVAWLAGLIWSDGNLSNGSLEIRTTDLSLAVDAYRASREQGSIRGPRYFQSGSKAQWSWGFYRKSFVGFLEQAGLHSNKSKTIRWPNGLPSQHEGSFLRGVLDGDGCVYFKKNNCRVLFYTASQGFAGDIAEALARHSVTAKIYSGQSENAWGKSKVFRVQCHRKSEFKILSDLMYGDGLDYFLPRKRLLLKQIIDHKRGRMGPKNTVFVLTGEEKLTVSEAVDRTGFPEKVIRDRISYGWSGEKIMTTPVRKYVKKNVSGSSQ